VTTVVSGATYRFTPSASDDDGDVLTFSVENLPSWATFSSTSGELTGRPSDEHIGTHSNIVITVTDGADSAELGPFAITVEPFAHGVVTLRWDPPSVRADGSALTDLAGYKVYWGTTSGEYDESAEITSPAATSYVIEGLGRGTYYFSTTAVSAKGLESESSNETSVTIP